MKIIDFKKKGNVVRFYLGDDNLASWHGDDWDDCPYEHNAGIVYDEYISGHKDIAFPFDSIVIEPCDGTWNSEWCKNDMIDRKVPCIIVVPKELAEESWYENEFKYWIGVDGVKRFYFGDKILDEDISPTIDAIPVVRCKDCTQNNQCSIQFKFADADHPGEWFCAYGKRR